MIFPVRIPPIYLVLSTLLKFIYSEKATKFCEISTLDFSCVVMVKSTVEILQNFVFFSKYVNFIVYWLKRLHACKARFSMVYLCFNAFRIR